MKIGLVKFLNARPLDFGLRQDSNHNPDLELLEDTPSQLYGALSRGELDGALISSVEVLRNREKFDYCDKVGVCARNRVDSIIYITPATTETDIESMPAPELAYTDQGSRTSAALLEVLLFRTTGKRVPCEPTPPEEIPGRVTSSRSGLLIGDSAIRFMESEQRRNFFCLDLAAWWHNLEGLPFVFALWAFPRRAPLPDSLFVESLNAGLAGMDETVARSDYPDVRNYLTEVLHYKLTEADHRSLRRFEELLIESGVL